MSNDPYEQFEATYDHERTSKRSFRKSILATTIVLGIAAAAPLASFA